jgi:hypothetical protein
MEADMPRTSGVSCRAKPCGVGGLTQGDVVYIADVYHQLDGDGGWAAIPPSALTKRLYELATSADGP